MGPSGERTGSGHLGASAEAMARLFSAANSAAAVPSAHGYELRLGCIGEARQGWLLSAAKGDRWSCGGYASLRLRPLGICSVRSNR
jgi:hypothetical protein